MNRRTIFARIVLWGLILAVLTGSFVSLMLREGVFAPDAATEAVMAPSDVEAPVIAVETADRGVVCLAAAQIDEIDLSWIAGSVEITTAPGEEVTFSEDYTGSSDKRLRYELSGGVLTIRYCENSMGSWDLPDKHLTLTLPEKRFARVCVELTSAELALSGVNAGQLEVDTASGDVKADGVQAQTLTLGSTSGRLTLTDCEAQTLKLGTVSGEILAEGTFDLFSADTTSGAVELRAAKLPQSIDVDTVSGSVTLAAPEDSAFRFDYDTVSGDLNNSLADAVEGSGATVLIDTVSGDLRLKPLEA